VLAGLLAELGQFPRLGLDPLHFRRVEPATDDDIAVPEEIPDLLIVENRNSERVPPPVMAIRR
jgi:hypothetical protein